MWIAIAAGIIIVIAIIMYNRLVSARNKIDEAFAAVDVYLQQRFDELCKLAQTVAAYTGYERETLTKVTELRSRAGSSASGDEKVRAYGQMDSLARGFTLQAENYPELRASDNYLHLQKSINDLEEKLSASRRTYNARVNRFNTMIQSFPTNTLAGMMNFTRREMLAVEESKKQDVDLQSILRG